MTQSRMYVLSDQIFPETVRKKYYPEIINYPDGQKHVKYDGPCGTLFFPIKNGDDLFMACQMGKILKDRFLEKPIIVCPWLFGLRCDRKFSEFEAVDKNIVTKTLLEYFGQVHVHCPHGFGNYANEMFNFDKIHETCLFSRAAFKCEADTIVIPDGGAHSRFDIDSLMHLCRQDSGQDLNLVVCAKQRDVSTGKLSGFEISSGTVGKRCLIIDDICDGGGTFVGIQKLLRDQGATEVYLSVYHGIFSKGRVEGIDGVYTTNSYTTPEMVDNLNKDGVWCIVRKVW